MSVKIEGLEHLNKTLETLLSTENMTQAMGQACAAVEASAKKKAPKDKGALRRSIASKVETEGGDIQGVVYTPLEYAPYVEYGTGLFAESGGRTNVPWVYQDDEGNWHSTKGQKPQPFLRPALNENRKTVVKILGGGIKK